MSCKYVIKFKVVLLKFVIKWNENTIYKIGWGWTEDIPPPIVCIVLSIVLNNIKVGWGIFFRLRNIYILVVHHAVL